MLFTRHTLSGILTALAGAGLGLFCPAHVAGGDWPQWRGPDRTNLSKEMGLLKTWPKDGPPLLWKAVTMSSYSTLNCSAVIAIRFSIGLEDRIITSRCCKNCLNLAARELMARMPPKQL